MEECRLTGPLKCTCAEDYKDASCAVWTWRFFFVLFWFFFPSGQWNWKLKWENVLDCTECIIIWVIAKRKADYAELCSHICVARKQTWMLSQCQAVFPFRNAEPKGSEGTVLINNKDSCEGEIASPVGHWCCYNQHLSPLLVKFIPTYRLLPLLRFPHAHPLRFDFKWKN